jgi:HD-GYP domain-containing protein (c-di-GMP phosphodiesterase class II)
LLNVKGTSQQCHIIKTIYFFNELFVQNSHVREHHENYDGTGYPSKIQGKDIHIYNQIVALDDVFDALSNQRVY